MGKAKGTLKEYNEGIYKELRMEVKRYANTIMLLDSSESPYCRSVDVYEFSKLVNSGLFYEHIRDYFSANGMKYADNPKEARDKAKLQTLIILYDDENKAYNRLSASPFALFGKLFPSVLEVFSFIKSKNYPDLAILLQRIESYCVLEFVCKRISKERPDLPIFTMRY